MKQVLSAPGFREESVVRVGIVVFDFTGRLRATLSIEVSPAVTTCLILGRSQGFKGAWREDSGQSVPQNSIRSSSVTKRTIDASIRCGNKRFAWTWD